MTRIRATVLLPLFLLVMGSAGLVACSSSDNDSDGGKNTVADAGVPDTGPLPYGKACENNEDCDSQLCVDGFCSKLCQALADCQPVRDNPDPGKAKAPGSVGGPCKDGACNPGLLCLAGKECVRAFECGRLDDGKVACYPRQYDTRPFTTGHNCSIDPRCGNSYKCIGAPGDSARFCSPECDSDKTCPAEMYCAKIEGYSGKKERRCMRREWGHPCDIDDQCGGAAETERGCVKDVNGDGYCSKTCSPTDPGSCPPYAKCEDAGNGRKMCKHKLGYANKQGAGLCEPCLYYGDQDGDTWVEEGGCATGGVCFQLSQYTKEASCLTPCGAGDTCPETNQHCFNIDLPVLSGKICAPFVLVENSKGEMVPNPAPCYPLVP